MPVDHFSIYVPVSKIDAIVTFLTSSLQHLGFKEFVRPVPFVVGMGESKPYFWITGINPEEVDEKMLEVLLKKQHIAFTAESESIVRSFLSVLLPLRCYASYPDTNTDAEQVRQFHAAALKAGGTCNGPPGLREHYHPGYYGAFARDPLFGLNFEVVCHKGA